MECQVDPLLLNLVRQLSRPRPAQWASLDQRVTQEIKLQTGALEDLLVIDPDVQSAKLDLLPSLGSR